MNYTAYRLSAGEWLYCSGEYIIIISVISYLFYDSWISGIVFLPFIVLFIKREKARKLRLRHEELSTQFLKALQSIATSLAAGFSPENSFVETEEDMKRVFGEKSIIASEMKYINQQVKMGIRIEDALFDFSQRSGNEQIEDFALIFSVARYSGGSFAKVISSCTDIIQMNKQTEDEARVLIRGKQYEQRIVSVIPLGIIAYLRISSGGFMDILYHNLTGVIVMTISLIVYMTSIALAERICNIEI